MKIQTALTAIFLTALFTARMQAKTMDSVAVKVNDSIITQSEIDDALNLMQTQQKLSGKEVQESKGMREKVLQNLIEQKLIITMAKEEGIEVSDDAVTDKANEFIDSLRQHYSTEQDFDDALQKEGITYGDFRIKIEAQVKDSLLYSKVKQKKQQEFVGKAAVSEDDIKSYYDANKDDFRTQDEVNISQIYAAKEGAEPAKLSALMDSAYARLKSGERFDAVLKSINGKNGIKGDTLGWVDVSNMDKKIKDAIRQLKKGRFTPVIETDSGFSIIYLNDSKVGEVKPYAEVREKARMKLIQEKVDALWQEWIDKAKTQAYIKYSTGEEGE